MSYEADTPTLDRVAKESVGYSPARADVNGEIDGDACGRCANYCPRLWKTSGACLKVEGPISGRYWCRLYETRGDGYATEKGQQSEGY